MLLRVAAASLRPQLNTRWHKVESRLESLETQLKPLASLGVCARAGVRPWLPVTVQPAGEGIDDIKRMLARNSAVAAPLDV